MKPIKIPQSITINTGEQEKYHVQKQIDEFFISVRKRIEELVNIPECPDRFKIDVKGLYTPTPATTATPSDDCIYMLYFDSPKYKRRVVASVLETRTEYNRVHFDFFTNLEGISL